MAKSDASVKASPKKPSAAPSPEPEVDESANTKGVGLRVPPAIHDELRRMAYETRKTINSIIIEGIQAMIEKYPPVKR